MRKDTTRRMTMKTRNLLATTALCLALNTGAFAQVQTEGSEPNLTKSSTVTTTFTTPPAETPATVVTVPAATPDPTKDLRPLAGPPVVPSVVAEPKKDPTTALTEQKPGFVPDGTTPAPATPPVVGTPKSESKVAGDQPKAACTLISISVPALPTDKPATYDPTIKDMTDGLVDALKVCNPKLEVAGFIPNSTKSARIKVTQGLDSQAFLKVPTDRLPTLLIQFYINKPDWTGDRFWTSGGPLAGRTELVLVKANEKTAGKIY